MKKLQLLTLCSLLAAGSGMNLQASWFGGKTAEAAKPVDAPKPVEGKAGKIELNDAQKKQAEQNKISEQNKQAINSTNSMAEQQKTAVDKLSTDAFKKQPKQTQTSSFWSTKTTVTEQAPSSVRPRANTEPTSSINVESQNAKNTGQNGRERAASEGNVPQTGPIRQALNDRGQKISANATSADIMNSNAKTQSKDATSLKEKLKAQNDYLSSWNPFSSGKSSAPQPAVTQ